MRERLSARELAVVRDAVARARVATSAEDELLEVRLIASRYAKVSAVCVECGAPRMVAPSTARHIQYGERTGRCRRCYLRAHRGFRHGTVNGYGAHKCRCDACCRAKADYMRGWRERRAA